MDRGAWWAAVSGVAQSRTQLERLSGSSSSAEHSFCRTVNTRAFSPLHTVSPPSLCLVSFSFLVQCQFMHQEKRKEPAGILQEPALDSPAVLLWTELFNLSAHSTGDLELEFGGKQWHELNCDVKLNVRHIFAVTLSPTWDCLRSFRGSDIWPSALANAVVCLSWLWTPCGSTQEGV